MARTWIAMFMNKQPSQQDSFKSDISSASPATTSSCLTLAAWGSTTTPTPAASTPQSPSRARHSTQVPLPRCTLSLPLPLPRCTPSLLLPLPRCTPSPPLPPPPHSSTLNLENDFLLRVSGSASLFLQSSHTFHDLNFDIHHSLSSTTYFVSFSVMFTRFFKSIYFYRDSERIFL